MYRSHFAPAVLFLSLIGCVGADERLPSDDATLTDPADSVGHVGAIEKGVESGFVTMTLNTRIPEDSGERDWSVRQHYINTMVRRFSGGTGPDLLALQELRDHSANDLQRLLGGHQSVLVNRGDGEILGLMVKRERFDVVSHAFRNTSNSDRDDLCKVREDEDSTNRPIVFAHVRDRHTGHQYSVFVVHYPSKNSCERDQMAKIVSGYMQSQHVPGSEIILMGDFNDGVKGDGSLNGSYQRIIDYTGFRNTFQVIHPMNSSTEFTTETTTWVKGLRHGRMIDPILISGGIAVADAYTDKTMFTASGQVVDCPVVSNGICAHSGHPVDSLRLYSDHWANWAVLYR